MMHTNDLIDHNHDSHFDRLLRAGEQGLPYYLTFRSLRHLKYVSLVTMILPLLTCIITVVLDSYPAAAYRPFQWGINLALSLISLITFKLLCSRGFSLRFLVNVALTFQVTAAFLLNFWDHFEPFPSDYDPRLLVPFSFMWIVVFPLLFPTTLKRVTIAAILSALTTPVTIFIMVLLLGRSMPPFLYFHFIFSNILGAALSIFLFKQFNKIQIALAKQQKLGSYQLKEKLGEGGMGEVWIASHAMLRRTAVIKLIHPKIMATPEEKRYNTRRFEREAQSIASLYSPNTIEIYDFGHMEDGTFFYVMEHLHGIDLERLLHQYGAMSQERAVFLLNQICASLEEAHQQGFIHRDIKPGNIFICIYGNRYDFIKVLDFGIVKDFKNEVLEHISLDTNETLERLDFLATRPGSLCGTPLYMAPEMILGEKVNAAYDIYAWGCLAYHMLNGSPLFAGKQMLEILSDHISTVPTPLSKRGLWIHPEFESLIMQCLEKDPLRRPSSMSEISQRLTALSFPSPWNESKAKTWWSAQNILEGSTHCRLQDAATALATDRLVIRQVEESG